MGDNIRIKRSIFQNFISNQVVSMNIDFDLGEVDNSLMTNFLLNNRKIKHINAPIPQSTATNPPFCNGCFQLETISVPPEYTSLLINHFSDCRRLIRPLLYEVDGASGSVPGGAFGTTYSLVEAVLSPNVTFIGASFNTSGLLTGDFKYMTGLTTIGPDAFRICGSCAFYEFPDSLTTISSGRNFQDNFSCLYWVFLSTTPPSLGATTAFSGINPAAKIYVPDASVAAYKAATNWSTYADYIYPLSTKP
jgi:hypothetical protein